MRKFKFKIDRFEAISEGDHKLIHIYGPEDFPELQVDFDDVDHDAVEAGVTKLVTLLEKSW